MANYQNQSDNYFIGANGVLYERCGEYGLIPRGISQRLANIGKERFEPPWPPHFKAGSDEIKIFAVPKNLETMPATRRALTPFYIALGQMIDEEHQKALEPHLLHTPTSDELATMFIPKTEKMPIVDRALHPVYAKLDQASQDSFEKRRAEAEEQEAKPKSNLDDICVSGG